MKRLPVWVKSLVIAYIALGAISGTAEAAFHLTRANGSTEPTKGMNFLPEITGIETQPAPVYRPQRASGRAVGRPVVIHEPTTSVWDRIAACESGGNWSSTVGRYDGGLQFHPSTWRAAGGERYAPTADQASREEQIAVAEAWLAKTSWAQWPACSRRLGLR